MSLLITIALALVVRQCMSLDLAKEILGVSISTLAIVFSVFFAALAVLITAGDNEFVRFLQEDGSYTEIIWTFKFSLLILFFALIVSIVLFVVVLSYGDLGQTFYFPRWMLAIFVFITVYALFVAASSSLDAIKYAEYRAKYLEITRQNKE